MATARTLRERIRSEMSREIKAAASRQLADHGAAVLSLRAVARELGLASSAVYRYFKSRDDLLTELIIDAYDSLGQAAEDAEQPLDRQDLFGRWSAVCHAVRRWALEHPHEYALIYGSPVPGYRAPRATVGPASRVTTLLARIAQDGVQQHALTSASLLPPADARATASVAALGESMLSGVPEPLILAGLMAWLEIFGAVSFELFGQLNNVVSDNEAFFDHSVRSMATLVGLPLPSGSISPAGRTTRRGRRDA
jgi:AcrR family transcriptional regulator